jgi:hypothetical protein
MNTQEFQTYLKRTGRKVSAIQQIIALVLGYQDFLQAYYPHRSMAESTPETLESYASWIESEPRESASKPLWALRYYFDFIQDQDLSRLAGQMRAERIKRVPVLLRDFRGVTPPVADTLAILGIENIDQMLDAGRTPVLRQALANQTNLPLATILELVKLSDLARLDAVRRVRARLYHDTGLTPASIATWEPQALGAMLVEWVEQHDFDGIPPTPKEVEHLVADARKLPTIVIYDP